MPNKTLPNNKSVTAVFEAFADESQYKDCLKLTQLFSKTLQENPVVWGDRMIGFGSYEYQYKTGRKGTWFLSGFAPRKQAISLYLMCDLDYESLPFENLGVYKKGKGCLYIKRLEDVDQKKLKILIKTAADLTRKMWSIDG